MQNPWFWWGKPPNSIVWDALNRKKRKNLMAISLFWLSFFKARCLLYLLLTLTISSPETNSVCPQAKAGLLEPLAPHHGPHSQPGRSLSRRSNDSRRAICVIAGDSVSTSAIYGEFPRAFMFRNLC